MNIVEVVDEEEKRRLSSLFPQEVTDEIEKNRLNNLFPQEVTDEIEKNRLNNLFPQEVTDQVELERLNSLFTPSDIYNISEEPNVLEALGEGFTSPGWGQRQLGSSAQWLSEQILSMPKDGIKPMYKLLPEEQQKEYEESKEELFPQLGKWGEELYALGNIEREEALKQFDTRSPEWYSFQIASGLTEMTPMLATSIVTKKPSAGMVEMMGQFFPQFYSEGREKGLDPATASDRATWYTISEVVPEGLVVGKLMAPGSGNLVKDMFGGFFKGAKLEGFQEIITEALQMGIDQGYFDENVTFSDALQRLIDAGIIGAGVGGPMGAVAAPFTPPPIVDEKEEPIEGKFYAVPPTEPQEPLTPRQQAQADPFPSESSSPIRQGYEAGARLTYRKPLAALDPIVEWFEKYPETKPMDLESQELYNPALELKKLIEHPDTFSGIGDLNRADWFEKKTSFIGEVRAPIDLAFDKYRTRIGKKLNKKFNNDVRVMAMDLIKGETVDPRDTFTTYQNIAFRHDDPVIQETAYRELTKEQQYEVDVLNAAVEIQNTLEKTHGSLGDAGIDVITETGEHIFPQVLDMSAVRDDIQGFKRFLQDHPGFQEDINAVNSFFDQLVRNRGNISSTLGDVRTIGDTTEEGFERVKRIDVPEKYLEKDLEKILNNYINQSANKIATGRALGKEIVDEETGEVSYDTLGKFKDLMSDLQEGLRRGGKVPDPEMLDDIRSVVEGLQGRYNPIKNPTKARMMRGLSTFETASHLTGASLSSVVEPFLGIPRAGIGNFVKAIPGLLDHMVHGLPRILSPRLANKARSTMEAEQVGNALDSVSMELLTAGFTTEYSNLTELFFRSPLGLWLHQFTRSMRVFSVGMGLQKMQGWMNTINKDSMTGKQREYFEKQVKDLGISPKEFEGISRLTRDLFGGKIDLLNQDFMDMRINKYGGYNLHKGTKVRDLLNPALVRFTNDIVMSPRITNKPLNTSDPHYSWASLFWSYPITFSNTVLKQWKNRIKNPCTPRAQFFAEMIGMLAAMYGLATLINEVKNMRRTGEPDFEGSDELVVPAFEDTPLEAFTPTEETYRNIESSVSYHVPGKPAVLSDVDRLSRDFTDYMSDKIEGEELIAKLYDFMTMFTQNIDWVTSDDEGIWGEREEMREEIIEALE